MKKIVQKGLTLLVTLFALLSGYVMLQEKVSGQAYKAAFSAMESYRRQHPEELPRFLAVVDYSKPSYLQRMTLIDLKTGDMSFYLVAHGIHSGELYATRFSNNPESGMSSLGLYKTVENYNGSHGISIRLKGLDPLLNSNAFSRNIVLHSAEYVSLNYIFINLLTGNTPRIGRSNGCFVLSPGDIDEVVEKLNQGAFLYAWAE